MAFKWVCECAKSYLLLWTPPQPKKKVQQSQPACSGFWWEDIWRLTACQLHVPVCSVVCSACNVLLGDNNFWESDVTPRGGGRGGACVRGGGIRRQISTVGVDLVTDQLVVKLVRLAPRAGWELLLKARRGMMQQICNDCNTHSRAWIIYLWPHKSGSAAR